MSNLSTRNSAEQRFIQLLTECSIDCTYSHIRSLLKWLWNRQSWSFLYKKLAEYQLDRNDNDTVYVLCQVARQLNNLPLLQEHSRPSHVSSYAVGVIPLFLPEPPKHITLISALEHLLNAYKIDKALDIQIAILLIYEQLEYFNLRRYLLQGIVKKISRNLNYILKIPLPITINKEREIELIIKEYLYAGKVKEAENKLQYKATKISGYKILELELNLAICRTLQGDLEGALDYLIEIALMLNKGEIIEISSAASQTYYQLAMYVYYKLGKFQQLHNIVKQAVDKDLQPWLQTWLGYVFFATGNYQLSQTIIQQNAQNLQLQLQENLLWQEYILLHLYWQDAQQKRPKKLKDMEQLRQRIFQPNSSNLTQKNLDVRLFPKTFNFEKMLDNAQQYNLPEYAIKLYYDELSSQDVVSNREMAQKLVDLAVRTAKFDDAKRILREHLLKNPKDQDAYNLLINFYRDFLLLPDELDTFFNQNPQIKPLNNNHSWKQDLEELKEIVKKMQFQPSHIERVKNLIEGWIKSPYEHDSASKKLVTLLTQSPALRNLYWSRQDLRDQIWQALDLSLDYSTVEDIKPSYLNLEVLEDTVFHLLYVGLNPLVYRLINSAKEQILLNHGEKVYLNVLENLSHEHPCADFHKKIYYLLKLSRLSERSLSSIVDPKERLFAISALEILVYYPDVNRQTPVLLLLGELQEIENEYLAASSSYKKVALEIPGIDDTNKLLAALRLMRLLAISPEVSGHEDLPTKGEDWKVKEKIVGELLACLAQLLKISQIDEEGERVAEILRCLQLTIEVLYEQKEYEPLAIKSLLHALHQLPNGRDCAMPLYDYLVRTDEMKGLYPQEKNFKQTIYLFLDYELANQAHEELAEKISSTLKTLFYDSENIARRELARGDRGRSKREEAYKVRDKWDELQKSLTRLKDWVQFSIVIEDFEEIELKAKAVQDFLSTGERLSKSLFLEATQKLKQSIITTGKSQNDYSLVTNQLINDLCSPSTHS